VSFRNDLEQSVGKVVQRRLDGERKKVHGPVAELSPRESYFGAPQGGDNFNPSGVTGLRTPGGSSLDGEVIITGEKGLAAGQAGQTILLLPAQLAHLPNPRTPQSDTELAALAGSTIFLHPLEAAGWMSLLRVYLAVEKSGSPDDNLALGEIALYRRNDDDDGFTRELRFGPFSFNDLTQLGSGSVHSFALADAVELPAGQHFLAVLYSYSGDGGYLLGQVAASGFDCPGAGTYQAGTATELPAELPDTDFSGTLDCLFWAELAGE